MATSLVYRSPWLYELAMRGLYRKHYAARYKAIAALVPHGANLLELCCGPATLYHRYLRAQDVEYRGIDLSPRFIAALNRSGAFGEVRDLRRPEALPSADYVLMQASLYQFLPDAGPIIERMLSAARQQLILAEPVHNLADSSVSWVGWIARRSTDAGSGALPLRFNEESLDRLLEQHKDRVERAFFIPGGREKIYVLRGKAG